MNQLKQPETGSMARKTLLFMLLSTGVMVLLALAYMQVFPSGDGRALWSLLGVAGVMFMALIAIVLSFPRVLRHISNNW